MKLLLLALCLLIPSTEAAQRSRASVRAFVRANACPSTHLHKLPCKGYVVDHIEAIDCGGKDVPENMQWQTIAAAKAKDKWERNGANCKHRTHGDRS